jgi:hypothetical protein
MGAEIAQKSEETKRVGSSAPHIFSLVLRNLGPQTPSGHNCCTI